jgi:hypothetical protein
VVRRLLCPLPKCGRTIRHRSSGRGRGSDRRETSPLLHHSPTLPASSPAVVYSPETLLSCRCCCFGNIHDAALAYAPRAPLIHVCLWPPWKHPGASPIACFYWPVSCVGRNGHRHVLHRSLLAVFAFNSKTVIRASLKYLILLNISNCFCTAIYASPRPAWHSSEEFQARRDSWCRGRWARRGRWGLMGGSLRKLVLCPRHRWRFSDGSNRHTCSSKPTQWRIEITKW